MKIINKNKKILFRYFIWWIILRLANILTIFSLVILFISLITPWITFRVPFLGTVEMSLLDIMVKSQGGIKAGAPSIDGEDGSIIFRATVILTILLFILSAAISLYSLKDYRYSLPAGISGILGFVTWLSVFYQIEGMFLDEVGETINKNLLSGLIDIGFGAYILLIFSALSISTYIIATKENTLENR